MSTRKFSFGTLSRLGALIVGLLILAGCGGGSSSTGTTTSTGTAAVSLNPTSLTFSSGVGVTTAAQSVTVTNSGTATLTFSSITTTTSAGFAVSANTCGTSLAEGSACSISVTFDPTAAGSASGTLSIADNGTNSPQTVTLTGTGASVAANPSSLSFTGVTQGTTSSVQSVTLDNTGSSSVAITSITASAGFGEVNNCGASLAANSTCTINVTFTPSASGSATGTISIVDASGTQTVNLTGSTSVSNSVSVTAGFGPNGYTGPPTATSSAYYNGVFTSVTVCQPGTSTCATVPNVLVDTGSVGLRVLQSVLTADGVTLTQNNDGSGNLENECVEYGDGSFNWGPIAMATVQLGGETASQVPTAQGGSANTGIAIQLISGDTVPKNVVASDQCVASSDTPDEYTVATLGANGILGVGTEPNDCSLQATNYCTNLTLAEELSTYPYWFCTTAGVCEQEVLSSNNQVLWNPVNAFASGDTGGLLLSLPSIPATGAASVSGTLTFGIGTASDNALGSATVYELDADGNFASASFNGVSPITSANSGGTFIDSGSNALFVSDPTTLGTTDCLVGGDDIGYYCPSSTLTPSLGLTGANSTTTTVTLNIANALNLFSANTSFADFYNLGGPSCIPETGAPCSLSTDYFDLGLPFFYGRPIFVGIAGTNTTYPNGYWAF